MPPAASVPRARRPAAGYSGTPLPRKLGFRPGIATVLSEVPAELVGALAPEIAAGRPVPPGSPGVELYLAFARSRDRLPKILGDAVRRLAPNGMLWVAWAKRSSGVGTDVTEAIVREAGLAAGLVDVKICAISAVWSGLKFVRRTQDRPTPRPAPPARRAPRTRG